MKKLILFIGLLLFAFLNVRALFRIYEQKEIQTQTATGSGRRCLPTAAEEKNGTMENPGACLYLSFPVALQDVVYRRGNVDAHCIFFRQLFRIESENRYSPYGNNDVQLDGLYL